MNKFYYKYNDLTIFCVTKWYKLLNITIFKTGLSASGYFRTIREIFAAFFEGYHSFVLSTFVLLVSILILSAGKF